MNMSKKLSFLLSIFTLVMLLVACGNSSDEGAESVEAEGQKQITNYDELIAAAKEEGKLTYWGLAPTPNTMTKLMDAFEQDMGFRLEVEQVSLSPSEIPARLVAESQSGNYSVDVFWGAAGTLQPILERDLIADVYPWTDVFSERFPNMSDYVDNAIEPLTGRGVEYFHIVDGLVYNTNLVKEEELPQSYEDLLDPRWKNLIAVNMPGFPYNELAFSWELDRIEELVKGIMAQNPHIGQGAPATVQAVSSGQAHIALADITAAYSQIQGGAPLAYKLMDPTPVRHSMLLQVKEAKNANAAKVWMAWFATEGRKIYNEAEGHDLVYEGTALYEAIQADNVELALPKSIDQYFNEALDAQKVVTDLIMQQTNK